MTNQSVDVEVTKPEDEHQKALDAESMKRIDQLAEEVAEQGSRTEQKFDKDHQIFSK